MRRVSLGHTPHSLSPQAFSADSVAGWDQLAVDFAPRLLPRADKWSQLLSSNVFRPRAHPRQGFRNSSKSPALVSLDFVVVVIDKYWIIHKALVRDFGSISQLQLLAGRLSRVLGTEGIYWEKNCTFSVSSVAEMVSQNPMSCLLSRLFLDLFRYVNIG